MQTAQRLTKKLIAIKVNLATLKIQLIIWGILLAVILLFVFISGIIAMIGDTSSKSNMNGNEFQLGLGQAAVSAQVEQYRDAIQTELLKYNLVDLTDLLLAQMQQESGGYGGDPMQASESKCGAIGCITSPQESIEYGVKHFVSVYNKANKDIKLTLQSYNFGGGFIDYVMKRGGEYTKNLAISFSQMMYKKLAHTGIYKCHRPSAIKYKACYGDIEYVEAVFRYLPSATAGNIELSTKKVGNLNAPVNAPLNISSPFGWRNIGAGPEFHLGIDIPCSTANSIHAAKKGQVVHAGMRDGSASSYGNFITIKHSETFYTTYAHLSTVKVKKGQTVKAGQGLGYCGSTGRSYGSHLHFETKTQMWGGHMNPARYLGL